jgi:hypothetical protein
MKLILSLFILSLSITASAHEGYHLVSMQVTPEGAEYPCEKSANLMHTDYGYAFEYVGEYQTATNPGVYFSGINKGRVCKKNETSTTCETTVGSTEPLSLTKTSCTTLLPTNCSKGQDQISLQQNGENQLILTYTNLQKSGVQQAVCIYEL